MDDLISRAAAIEHMKSMAGCATCNNYNEVRCRACEWNDAMDIVDEAPAVDAVPVVHARWIDENPDDFLDPRMRCSICTGVESPLLKWRYCPNCGARMDGEQREATAWIS